MILKQVIDNLSPLTYWTGESYTSGNIFDEYSNHSIVSTGLTLGEVGSSNPNLSSRAINLNGGYGEVVDTSFTNDNLANRNLSISFNFRIPNRDSSNPIIGTKTIVSKWVPDMNYAITMDSGIISAYVLTNSGTVSLDFDFPEIIYNNRWNSCCLQILPDEINLIVNGCVITVSNSDVISVNTTNNFTVGGYGGDAFTEDFLISDLAVLSGAVNSLGGRLIYIAPRDTKSRWLDFNPEHLYNLAETSDIDEPKLNYGKAGGNGYIQYTGVKPTIIQSNQFVESKVVNMTEGSKVVVDNPPSTVDLSQGFSFLYQGRLTKIGMTSSSAPQHALKFVDFKTNPNNDNGRFYVSMNRFGSNYWTACEGFDSSGTSIFESAYVAGDVSNHDTFGTKSFIFKSGDIDISHVEYPSQDVADPYTRTVSYDLPEPVSYMDIFSNTSTNGTHEVSYVGVFLHALPEDAPLAIGEIKSLTLSKFWSNIAYPNNYTWIYYAYNDSNLRYDFNTWQPTSSSNEVYINGVIDPNYNRQNQFQRVISLVDSSSYIGGSTTVDVNYNGSGFTQWCYIWNRNTQDRYRIIHNTADVDFEVWMNSRNGVFSYGDVEVMYDKDISDSHISTNTRQFVDDGFHFFTFVRNGLNIEIWIDGLKVASKVMASLPELRTFNSAMRLYGGPAYFSFWAIFDVAMNEAEIAFATFGLRDFIEGQCTLNGLPLESRLLITNPDNGTVLDVVPTDDNGRFKAFLPKGIDGESVTVLALANDDNVTNNIPVHGPYNLGTDYRKYVYELTVDDYDDMVLDYEPASYYRMNDTTTTISDSSGNSSDGTIFGTYTLDEDGPFGDEKSISFTGVDGYIDLPDGYSDHSNGFTFEGWVRWDSFSESFSRLFEFATAVDSDNAIFSGHNSTNSNILAETRNGGSTLTTITSSSPGFTLGTWQHFVFRISPDGTYSLWLNGTKINELVGSVPPTVLRTLNYFGRSTYATDGYYNGAMSNFALYDYALPDEEIERHNARGFEQSVLTMKSLILSGNPALYFTFDRLKGLNDSSGNELTFTEVGSTSIVKNALALNAGVVGNNYLTTNDYQMLPSTDGWAIEVCIKTGSTQNGAIIVGEWDMSGDTGTYKLQLNNSNFLSFHINNGATQLVSTTTYNDNEWHHVVIIESGGTLYLYVDGALEDSLASTITYGLFPMSVGNASDGQASYATSAPTYVDDLAIYEYAISSGTVTEHYNQFLKKKVYQ